MDLGAAGTQFCGFQFCHAGHHRGVRHGAVALITLILVIILAWNYLKLLLEAAERYVLLGVLVYTAPVAFSMGASQTTSNIWKSWCRMLGGRFFSADERLVPAPVHEHGWFVYLQPALFVRRAILKRLKKILFLALMVAALSCLFCQPAFAISEEEVQAQVDAVGKEAVSGNVLIWFMCAIGFLKVSQRIDSLWQVWASMSAIPEAVCWRRL